MALLQNVTVASIVLEGDALTYYWSLAGQRHVSKIVWTEFALSAQADLPIRLCSCPAAGLQAVWPHGDSLQTFMQCVCRINY